MKSTKVNSRSQYWAFDKILESVYLNYDARTDRKIYGSSKDNFIGIGKPIMTYKSYQGEIVGRIPSFNGYKGENTEKTWMKQDVDSPSSEKDIQTPFEVMEVSE
ncbi:hypothetical protein [Bacillus sp. CDB3]|uniref:hypothetical protein n=1 Tax=Bacillus sp. CDB3 TaxID=360310 RepID=UPI0015C46A67|nr:hypothetical protein [Bacillus sp. CDB3]